MVDDNAIITALEGHLPSLKQKAETGCSDAHVQWAMGSAILHALKAGYKLTDLDWFKNTSYYTAQKAS